MTDRPILIAGGGIGGLAAALGLARKGLESVVLEQSSRFGEIGAGIQIGPNAFHAFDYLGIGDAARAKAVYIDGLVLMDSTTGEQVARIPVDEPFRRRFGNPYAVVHRGDLHGVLLAACEAEPKVRLVAGQRVASFVEDDAGIEVTTADGACHRGSALIGADGLNSKIREAMFGASDLRISGHVAYRAVLPHDEMPEMLRWNAATLWAGPKCHLVHYPLQGWKVFNVVATFHTGRTTPGANEPATPEEVLGLSRHTDPRAIQLLSTPKEWRRWVLCDRDPIENWTRGRATLLGDAAHPMLQYFAQGACMALEDAVCLSHMAERHAGDLPAAFEAYQTVRIPRTARVQLSSRLIGEYVYHPSGATRLTRNAVLGAKTAEAFYDSLEWLYGGTGLGTATKAA